MFVEKFDRTQPDFTALAPRVAQKQPQAVVFVGTGAAVVDGIKALRGAGVTGQIVTLSNNASGGFIQQLGDAAHGVIVTQVFPNVRDMGYGINREADALVKAKGDVALSPQMMEGFAGAKVLVEALRRAGLNFVELSIIGSDGRFRR